MEPNMKNQKSDLVSPLHKQDDWGRRKFIQNVGFFLGAFGLPWTIRMDTMEKISKKIFGSSTAFAAPGSKTLLVCLGGRNGMPQQMFFPNVQDNVNQVIGVRNFHAAPGTTIRVNVPGSSPNAPMIFSPQLAGIAQSNHRNRVAVIGSIRNVTGHTNSHADMSIGGSDSIPIAHAAQSASTRILSNPQAFGPEADVTWSMKRSTTDAKFGPAYHQSFSNFRSQFTSFQIKGRNNTTLSSTLTNRVMGILNSEFNAEVISKLKELPDKTKVQAGADQLIGLLEKDLQTQLTPTAQDRTTFGMDLARPGNQFNRGNLNLGEFLFTVGRSAELGISEEFSLVIDTNDWHGTHATMEMANGGNADNSVQGLHAKYFNDVMLGALNRFENMTSLFTGNRMIEDIVIVIHSEFDRTLRDSGDNGDGDQRRVTFIAHENRIKGGTYANHNTNLDTMQWNPDTGNFMAGDLPSDYAVGTIMKVAGINAAAAGASNVRDLKITKI